MMKEDKEKKAKIAPIKSGPNGVEVAGTPTEITFPTDLEKDLERENSNNLEH